MPEMLPALSARQIKAMESMSYQERAVEIMSLFLEDYSREELRAFADAAYSPEKFDDPAVAPGAVSGRGDAQLGTVARSHQRV